MKIKMRTKVTVMLLGLALAVAGAARGDIVYDETFTINSLIPDDNPAGWQDSRTVSGLGAGLTITDVLVRLNISGGWNGDLYGYLRFQPTGSEEASLVVLLDRVGYSGSGHGYGDPGLAVTLSDAGSYGIENYQTYSPSYNESGQLTGTWKPHDGSLSFNSAFYNLNPNGTWTLFFADLAAGDQSQLVDWGLQIAAVPEPTATALGIFGALVGAAHWVRRRARLRRKEQGIGMPNALRDAQGG